MGAAVADGAPGLATEAADAERTMLCVASQPSGCLRWDTADAVDSLCPSWSVVQHVLKGGGSNDARKSAWT
jgi:hypothetical protein